MEDLVRTRIARLRRAAGNIPIFTKLIAIYIVVMLLPTLAIAFTAAGSVRHAVTREVEESNRHVVRQVASNIETRVDVARNVAESIAFNHRVRSFLLLPFSMTSYSLNVYLNQVGLLVNNALSFHTGSIHKATIYLENETIPEHWRMFLHASRLQGVPWYEEFRSSGALEAHIYPNTADHVPLNQLPDLRPVLTWVRRIDTVDGRYLGIVTLDMLERDVFEAVHEATAEDRRFAVVSDVGQIVYAPAGVEVDADVPGTITIVEPIALLGLSVQADFPMTALAQRTARATWTMVFSSFLGFLLSVGLAYSVLRILFSRVNTMVGAIHSVAEGDLSVRLPAGRGDELGQLARDFNHLIERINVLVGRVVVEERDKQQAQLAALQYQINPHFVYNTIDLFRMKLELEGSYETADAITSFGKMVRYTMAGDSMYVSLAAELDHVSHFVGLQRIRHEDRVRLEVDCTPETASRRVLKLVLQPIVENSVIHGLRPDATPLQIRVEARSTGRAVTVRVTDDGVGIPEERLRELRRRLDDRHVRLSAQERTDVGIGLANIAGRLQLFYGDSAAFEIASEEYHGTTVTVTFPQIP